MLKNLKTSNKLAFIVAIPMIGLIFFTVNLTLEKLKIVNEMNLLHKLSEFAIKSNSLVHELQKERGLSAGFIGSKEMEFSNELQSQRVQTNIALKKLKTFLKNVSVEYLGYEIKNNLARIFAALNIIEAKRNLVDSLNISLEKELLYYSDIIDLLLANINHSSMSIIQTKFSNQIRAYVNLLYAKEKAGIERATLNHVLSRDYFSSNLYNQFISLIEAQNIYLGKFFFSATTRQKKHYHDFMSEELIKKFEVIRQAARNYQLNKEATDWWEIATARIEQFEKIGEQLSYDLKVSASTLKKNAQFKFILYLIITGSMILLTLFYNRLILKETEQAYARFVPNEFLRLLNKRHILDTQLGNYKEMEMTILFSDIRSFTALSEKMSPQENFDFLNAYLKKMEPIIRKHNGFIDKYIGDAIMALFIRADDAINAAIEMSKIQHQEIETGIGINTGKLMLGIIGEKNRLQCTVISDAVNLASRVESLTKSYKMSLIITQNTLNNLTKPNYYAIQFIDNLQVKGREEKINIFEVKEKTDN